MRNLFTVLSFLVSFSILGMGQSQGTQPEVVRAVKRIGFQAGYSMAKNVFFADGQAETNQGASFLPAFNAGFFTEQGKSEYFTTQIGLYYQKKGGKLEDGNIHLHYIHVPMMMSIRMPIAGPVYMKAGLGPYASYAFMGKMETPIGDFMDIFSFPTKVASDNKPFNPFDFGVSFGGQVEYVLPDKRSIEIAVKYDVGIWKASNTQLDEFDEEYNPVIKNRVLSINLVYTFNLNKKD